MARVKRGIIHTKKRKRILRLAKGYRGGRRTSMTAWPRDIWTPAHGDL